VDWVVAAQIPGTFTFDSYFTNAPILNHIHGKQLADGQPRGYVGSLKFNRKLEHKGRIIKAVDLAAGTVTVQIQCTASFDAYAYEQFTHAPRADFIPALATPTTRLRFPQLVKGNVQMKTIVLFNPTDFVASTVLIALSDTGLELGRGYGGPLLPQQTLEVDASTLLSNISSEDLSTLVVLVVLQGLGRVEIVVERRRRCIGQRYSRGDDIGVKRLESLPHLYQKITWRSMMK